ncbi:MAG: hypothetical protein WC756_21150 [Taibaiella sp.]
MRNKKGEFIFKDEPINFDFIPVIGWIINEKGKRSPILVNGGNHEEAVIMELESNYWWWDEDCSGRSISSLLTCVKNTIENEMEYIDE